MSEVAISQPAIEHPWVGPQEWRNAGPEEHSLLVQVFVDGEQVAEEVFPSGGIAESAERAVARLVTEFGQPDDTPTVVVHRASPPAVFGPFPVEIMLLIEARCLRQDSQ